MEGEKGVDEMARIERDSLIWKENERERWTGVRGGKEGQLRRAK